jgi:hypothetical protein
LDSSLIDASLSPTTAGVGTGRECCVHGISERELRDWLAADAMAFVLVEAGLRANDLRPPKRFHSCRSRIEMGLLKADSLIVRVKTVVQSKMWHRLLLGGEDWAEIKTVTQVITGHRLIRSDYTPYRSLHNCLDAGVS